MIRTLILTLVMVIGSQASVRPIILKQEKEKGIPHGLLLAIASVESKESPYVVNAKGRSYNFKSAGEAANFVRKVQKEGYTNINVGCMQLNVPSHRRNFASIEKMIEPESNIAYAAKLLKRLERDHGSIEHAVRYYNSSCPIANTRYKQKVDNAWSRTCLVSAEPSSRKNTKVNLGLGRKSKKN